MCNEVVNNFASAADPAVINSFFQQYFLSIVQDTFFVLTDTDHKSGFKLQSLLLAHMFQLADSSIIQVPLFDQNVVNDAGMTNATYVKQYCGSLLKTAFPHVQP